MRGTSKRSTAAMRAAGSARKSVPGRPKARTSGVATTGPRANPALPPTEKKLIPLARREPET
jgi:hypothetical protein